MITDFNMWCVPVAPEFYICTSVIRDGQFIQDRLGGIYRWLMKGLNVDYRLHCNSFEQWKLSYYSQYDIYLINVIALIH